MARLRDKKINRPTEIQRAEKGNREEMDSSA